MENMRRMLPASLPRMSGGKDSPVRFKSGGSLRTGAGGHVPGEGQGDKVKALYEPGEFVVSNDMLDAAPELRSELSSLRGRVLAAKGMTPEQADAKAVRGGSLRALNGFEVTERPWNGSADSRAFASQPGPGNPNVGPNGSAEARAFRAQAYDGPTQGGQNGQGSTGQKVAGDSSVPRSTAQPQGAAVRGAPSVAGQPAGASGAGGDSGIRSAGATGRGGRLEGVRNAARATGNFLTGPGASGGSVTGAVKNVVSPVLRGAASLARVAGPLAAAATVAKGFGTDTETYARRFGLENTEPGLLRDMGVRALGVASDAGNIMTLGTAGQFYRDDAAPQAQTTPITPAATPALAPTQGNGAGQGWDSAAPAQAPTTLPPGTSLRSPGIFQTRRPGQAVEFGDEASLTDTGFRNRGAISSQNMAAADALSNRYAQEAQATLRQPQVGGVFIGEDTGGFGLLDKGRLADRERRMAFAQETKGMSARQITDARQAQTQEMEARNRALDAQRGDATARRGQDISEASSLRTDATARRGQDLDTMGRAAAGQAAAADSDRRYELDVARLGVETANKNRDDRRAGEAAFDKRIEGLVGTDKDGKPDARAASQVRNEANAYMAKKLRDARALLAEQPNNKSARAAVASIEQEGVAGIDDDILRTFMVSAQANRVAKETDTLWPFSSTSTNTSAPVTSLVREDNFLFPERYVTNNGQKISKGAVADNPDLKELIKPLREPR